LLDDVVRMETIVIFSEEINLIILKK